MSGLTEEISDRVAPPVGNSVYHRVMEKTYLLGHVPGSFTRHLHSSIDEIAICGAMSVPQGERKSATVLLPAVNAVNCGACAAKVGR